MSQLALGLDSSTQSLTAVVVDIGEKEAVYQKALDYLADPRLSRFGINQEYILPPQEAGEANQPVLMYLASLEALFRDMAVELPRSGLKMADIAVINISGQQHGHLLLNDHAPELFGALASSGSSGGDDLAVMLAGALSLPFARIWRTSCTSDQADFVRERVGGKDRIIGLSGSNAPLRFSAFGIRKTAQDHPEAYESTRVIHQISSLIPAVLTGNAALALDYGNACGTSLMDYREKRWSNQLLEAVSHGLPGGKAGLEEKLPPLASGRSLAGRIAGYFVRKFGFSPECRVGIGSGDNPQTKVLVAGSLLSLGTSLVNMVETDGPSVDLQGYANAMYDALDRPFMFGCRTNGALRWDNVRTGYGLARKDYRTAERALEQTPCGNGGKLYLWQAETESFPVSGTFGPVRIGYGDGEFAADYAGIVESTLAAVYTHSSHFTAPGGTLYVAGGPTQSGQIMRRVAAIWNRTVIPIEKGGAALGAAASGASALLAAEGVRHDPGEFCSSFLSREKPIKPDPADVRAYHGAGGYLERFREAESGLIS